MSSQPKEIKVMYQDRSIREAEHFLLSASDQRLLVECVIGKTRMDDPCMEINTRISMSWDAAMRLAQSLNSIIENQRSRNAGSENAVPHKRQASLLSVSSEMDAAAG